MNLVNLPTVKMGSEGVEAVSDVAFSAVAHSLELNRLKQIDRRFHRSRDHRAGSGLPPMRYHFGQKVQVA